MSDAEDLDFELVTNTRMLAEAPPLRKEAVTVPEWKTSSGKAARFLVWELTANEFSEYQDAGWVYKNGVRSRFDDKGTDVRFLAFTIRDQHGNRLWSDAKEAKSQLGKLGKSSLGALVAAANLVNSPKDEATEGNSGEIQSDS